MAAFEIKGFWSDRAGNIDPAKHLQTTLVDYKFFFQLLHETKEMEKFVLKVLVDGTPVQEIHDWMSKDGKETDVFEVPLEKRTVGRHTVQFEVWKPESKKADAKAGELVFVSEKFVLEYIR